jgi:hypothetical protein
LTAKSPSESPSQSMEKNAFEMIPVAITNAK